MKKDFEPISIHHNAPGYSEELKLGDGIFMTFYEWYDDYYKRHKEEQKRRERLESIIGKLGISFCLIVLVLNIVLMITGS